MILGYEIDRCPICEDGEITEIGETIVCTICKNINRVTLLAKILNITEREANIGIGSCGEIEEGILAKVNGVKVNSYNEGRTQYLYPSIFPYFPEHGNITIVDDISKVIEEEPNTISFNDWSLKWNPMFADKDVKIFYTTRKRECYMVASYIKGYAKSVKIGPYRDESKLVSFSDEYVSEVMKPKYSSLKELIDSFHMIQSRGGIVTYKRTLNVPMHVVIDSVTDWFIENGANLLWDDSNDQGYMIFRKESYRLDKGNNKFKSLMFELGGITVATLEGSAVISGMSSMAHRSKKIKIMPWIQGNQDENLIKINQGSSTIIISQNDIKVNTSDSLTYDNLLGDKWFIPVYEDELCDLKLLNEYVSKWFVVDDIAKEIILCWLLSIFLKDFSKIKPGMRISGKPSSGKSTILNIVSCLFYGSSKIAGYSTIAGLWREATKEPLLFIDNENVGKGLLGGELRTFLDLSATGADRTLGVANNSYETKKQASHSFILMSGLDSFLAHDVRTRYFEIEADEKFKTNYYESIDNPLIVEHRNKILWSVFNMFSRDVLPNISKFMNRDMCYKYRNLLGSKARIADYFMIMLVIGEALKKYEVISDVDLGERWCNYINKVSSKIDEVNAKTIEWWNLFRMSYRKNPDDFSLFIVNSPKSGKLMIDNGEVTGIEGSKTFALLCIRWAQKITGNLCPWARATELIDEMVDDKNAWKSKEGWDFDIKGSNIEIFFGEE